MNLNTHRSCKRGKQCILSGEQNFIGKWGILCSYYDQSIEKDRRVNDILDSSKRRPGMCLLDMASTVQGSFF